MNQHYLIFGTQKYRTISNYQNFDTSNIVLDNSILYQITTQCELSGLGFVAKVVKNFLIPSIWTMIIWCVRKLTLFPSDYDFEAHGSRGCMCITNKYPHASQKLALWVLLISFVLLQMCWWGINYQSAPQGSSVHVYGIPS